MLKNKQSSFPVKLKSGTLSLYQNLDNQDEEQKKRTLAHRDFEDISVVKCPPSISPRG